MKVGFIGVGIMGSQMADCLLDAGYDLTIHDIKKESAKELLDKGAKWASTPREVARACQVVFSSLPGPKEMEEVVYGPEGLIAGWKKGDIYVDMTTNSPATIRQVAKDAKAKGVEVLDAPVTGGQGLAEVTARAGKLAVIVGGDIRTFNKVRPLLKTMGDKLFHVGDVGCGNVVKLLNNMIGSTCNAISAECFVLGVKAGVDAETLREVIKVSGGNNRHVEHLYPLSVFQGNFSPGFRLTLNLKDIRLALALGREYGVPMSVAAAVEQRFSEAKEAGLGDMCSQAIILPLEKVAGVQVRSRKK